MHSPPFWQVSLSLSQVSLSLERTALAAEPHTRYWQPEPANPSLHLQRAAEPTLPLPTQSLGRSCAVLLQPSVGSLVPGVRVSGKGGSLLSTSISHLPRCMQSIWHSI